ncbi:MULTISPECIES: carbon storage regulator [Marinobacter]|jgi:carbon storage regulator|uniref:carbon storage regulator n=1 Tax=Marinobacter TaxID=2742 RepID=UPI0009F2A85C|nr:MULTISPECIES: carbon storage regulator [Marinobacter]MAI33363.1 carbon storage regulator [Rhodopirellula sp.]MBL3558821.1 carbon storage regulator [Marinobacter sp. JB05H06]MCD1649673.1 carbon storage regulator [Marinobacter adhaerens]MCP4063903.1 carbon storage regulator [Gammaproteobacteria bacterium]|tara:strand:+ start:376 stop:630 length:255 start_codon:yes stop_codon:yes gene_type:complete
MALTLERMLFESIIINDNIKITVTRLDSSRVKLSIDAPPEVAINREEVFNRIIDQKPQPEQPAARRSIVRRLLSRKQVGKILQD